MRRLVASALLPAAAVCWCVAVETPKESMSQKYLLTAGRPLTPQQLIEELDIPSHGTKNRYKTILPTPDLVSTHQNPAQDLVSTNQNPAQDLVSTNQNPAPDLVFTYQNPAPDLVSTYQNPRPEVYYKGPSRSTSRGVLLYVGQQEQEGQR
ncbi:hypothetical protein CRUP_013315 [Coryphaenoides rupestris]|nr:hypothetical protein CRUP_013315 [Coryphaenoides rupestris]